MSLLLEFSIALTQRRRESRAGTLWSVNLACPESRLALTLLDMVSQLGELGLFCVLALEALIFSKIEGWSFFDGLYFSLVVSLTIGYGDFSPTHASTKVLLFPFAIITVACK